MLRTSVANNLGGLIDRGEITVRSSGSKPVEKVGQVWPDLDRQAVIGYPRYALDSTRAPPEDARAERSDGIPIARRAEAGEKL